MGYYSDPTASAALGNINREFSKLEKKAKNLRKLFAEGKISEKTLKKAQSQFTGIYRYVLDNALNSEPKE
ncbi:MAG: hypothetical protein E7560_04085 [Ruminococcaceae bacterium]|nr:hypothetical protein [Oscillospiraceae bacterium]